MNVIFLPGSLCDARLFGSQVAAATKAGFSCQVQDLSIDDSIEAMAARVIASIPRKSVLVGLSMGAIVAAEIVSQAPDRLAGVALMNTNLRAPDSAQLATRSQWARQVRSGEFARVVADNLTDALTFFPSRNSQLIFDMAMSVTSAGFLRQNKALLHRRDRRNDVAQLSAPVLITAGSDDQVCPPALHADLAERLPRARFQIVDQAGHLSTLDQPAVVSDMLIDWLTFCNEQIHTQEGIHEHQHA